MINVVYDDIKPLDPIFKLWRYHTKNPGIFNLSFPNKEQDNLEVTLTNADVLLTHPGITEKGRNYVLDIHNKFPNLKIGVMSYLPKDYVDLENFNDLPYVSIFDRNDFEGILEFLFSARPSPK